MTHPTRRTAMATLAAGTVSLGAVMAHADSAAEIEADVNRAEQKLFATVPGTRELAAQARGVLIMPDVIKGGLIVGGSYGEGALKIGGVVDGYYSVAAASIGYQIGVQSTSHALFFMTQPALDRFRNASGWELGADAEFTVPGDGISLNLDTTTIKSPVIAVIFAQDGLLAGASLEGAKYTRIAR
ncbi:MAG: YSC84-related protein [Pseudomonadota bacterium]